MVVVGALFGCSSSGEINSSTGAGNTGGGDSGLPCDVAALLSAHCTSCHTSPTVGGAPMPLLTYADLAAPSQADPSQSNAQRSLARMKSAAAPMPPAPASPVTAIAFAAFETWVAGGLPKGTCGGADAGTPDPTFQGDPICSSNTFFEAPSDEDDLEDLGELMYPGRACITCHEQHDENKFKLGGTVFALGKVLDDCLPAPGAPDLTAAQVIIHDANGAHQLSVNEVGNFRSHKDDDIVFPYTAEVVYQGKSRAMSTMQSDGDCNKCHSATGSSGAPGRIALP
ncbi:Hypothetical protein A7982_11158 [Minicystis rosea]|nr:Hypothetical protein A7982_11158 [Minicystis rosea]